MMVVPIGWSGIDIDLRAVLSPHRTIVALMASDGVTAG